MSRITDEELDWIFETRKNVETATDVEDEDWEGIADPEWVRILDEGKPLTPEQLEEVLHLLLS